MKVTYVGCSDEQVRWGSCDDPRSLLTIGHQYTVSKSEEHMWHTKYILAEYPEKKFNSVCFK